jgi:hypothetical protein
MIYMYTFNLFIKFYIELNKRFVLKKKKYMPVVIIDLTNVFLSKIPSDHLKNKSS